MTKTLDLGCGDKPRNPFHADEMYGIDVRSNLAGNIRSADLAIESIPFDSDSFDYVTAYDFIEHIPRVIYTPNRRNAFIEVMNEVYRVLKPGGLFLSHTPAFPHGVAFRDPTHVNIITEETFPQYFDDQLRWGSIYGFNGAFKVRMQKWIGPHIFCVLQKVASPDWARPPSPGNARITLIIPVHNGERFISKTLDSALAQTAKDFEVLCVDDASTDGSARILQHYAARDNRIKVLSPPCRLGSAPKSLNHALPHMTGGYFVYSSQDDLFSPDWLEKMHARAQETDADAVIPEVVMFDETNPSKNRTLSGLAGDRNVVISGRDACLHSLDWSIPGNALWNARIIRQLGFSDFSINSDEYSVRRFFLECNKVTFSGGKFLYRQDNPEAVTKRVSASSFDWPLTQLHLAQLLLQNNFPADVIHREYKQAQASILRLANKLDKEWSASWTTEEIANARAAVLRFHNYLESDHVFAWPSQEKKFFRHSSKWKKSLLKLPKKLGLR